MPEWSDWTDADWLPPDAKDFGECPLEHPRMLVVPFAEYIGGQGANAQYVIHKFGVFWLEDVITNGNNRQIVGRFVDHMTVVPTGRRISKLIG